MRMKCDIKFVDSVPPPSGNFGLKMFGQVCNDWLKDCRPDEWCSIEACVGVIPNHDGNWCLLIFDTMGGPRKVLARNLIVEVFL